MQFRKPSSGANGILTRIFLYRIIIAVYSGTDGKQENIRFQHTNR
jgi:hypothetical protein